MTLSRVIHASLVRPHILSDHPVIFLIVLLAHLTGTPLWGQLRCLPAKRSVRI